MKKVLLTCFSLIMIMGVMVACSNETATPQEELKKQKEKMMDKEISGEKETDTEEKQEVEEKTETTETTADVTNAVDFMEALDPNNPVPLGTYMKSSIYSTLDRKYHTVYVKLNKITSETDDANYIQKVIDENNAEGYDFDAINKEQLELPDDVELNVIDYEVAVPKEFPITEYGGVTGINIMFAANSIEGGGIPSNNGGLVYLALGTADKLLSKGDRETTFMPGNTYNLRAYFMMVKGYDDYVIEVNSFPEGSDGSNGMKTSYFGIK